MNRNALNFFLMPLALVLLYNSHIAGQVINPGDEWEKYRYCRVPLKDLKIRDVSDMLRTLQQSYEETFRYEKVGTSVQGRPVFLVKLGSGDTRVLLWSQMHGDEPTATAALFDVFNFLMQTGDSPYTKEILDNITILAVPMLNPDGAEKFKRRNAQGLDINRDARDRQSPEGRILFNLKEKYKPQFGFNLHDQNARRTVGNSNKLAGIALMAPPYDATDNDNEVRLRAKKIVSVIYEALGPHLYGHISKYDAEYMPRAFGDAMQNWGVSTVLIESGGWYRNRGAFLQKMNYIALLASFHAIASGGYRSANPAVYDILQQNDKNIYDLLISDATVIDGTGIDPYRIDIGINYNKKKAGIIVDTGDLDIFAARDTIDAADLYVTPGLIGALNVYKSFDDGLAKLIMEKAAMGFTTLLLPFDKDPVEKMHRLESLVADKIIPVNLGVLLVLGQKGAGNEQILASLREYIPGITGYFGSAEEVNNSNVVLLTRKPALEKKDLLYAAPCPDTDPENIRKMTLDQAERWSIPARGKIRRGQHADLVFFQAENQARPVVHSVLLNGRLVYRNGRHSEDPCSGDHWFRANGNNATDKK